MKPYTPTTLSEMLQKPYVIEYIKCLIYLGFTRDEAVIQTDGIITEAFTSRDTEVFDWKEWDTENRLYNVARWIKPALDSAYN